MSFEILIEKKVEKFLKNLEKGQSKEHDKIIYFLYNTLKNTENPCTLPNAKHLL